MKNYLYLLGSVFLLVLLVSGKSDKKDDSETYRPQFHFSPQENNQREVQGLVCLENEYHLFYKLYPLNNDSTDMVWGQAVSQDLLHWEQLENTIIPDGICTEWSGSAVVDEQNLSGLKTGESAPILFLYKGDECEMKLVYSNDRGRSWNKFEGSLNIPLDNQLALDPNIFWHEDSQKYVMTLWTQSLDDENGGILFYSSSDLINWQYESTLIGISDSPVNLVEMSVDSSVDNKRWLLFDSSGSYYIGDFDGKSFTPEPGIHVNDYGINFYGPQTCKTSDERIVQIASLLGGSYPDMPFNGQMTFPVELSLKSTPEGVKLIRKPIAEIEALQEEKGIIIEDEGQYPGLNENLVKKASGDCLRIIGTFEPKKLTYFGFVCRSNKSNQGTEVYFDASNNTINCLGSEAELMPVDGKIKLDILLDRTSVEIFGNDGEIALSVAINAEPKNDGLVLFNNGGEIYVEKLEVYNIKSIYGDN